MPRGFNTTVEGKSFSDATIEAVWEKGKPEPAYPGFRKDACGGPLQWENNRHKGDDYPKWECKVKS